jgi:hypothetical protein
LGGRAVNDPVISFAELTFAYGDLKIQSVGLFRLGFGRAVNDPVIYSSGLFRSGWW